MAITRSTANSEVHDDIILTVSPDHNGIVSVKQPNPDQATFQVDDPNCRLINSDNNGTKINNIGGAELHASWIPDVVFDPSFYREGSRVFMDGRIRLTNAFGWSSGLLNHIMTLPPGYRPAQPRLFNVSAWLQVTAVGPPGGVVASIGSMRLSMTATIGIGVTGGVWLDSASGFDTGLGGSYGFATNNFGINGVGVTVVGSWIEFSGVNFQCSGTPT